MLPQQLQQPEPQNKVNTFMEKAGWSVLSTVLGGIIVFVITVWLGKIQVVNFTWLMLVLGILMVIITIFSVWYSQRTRLLLQKKYHNDLVALRREFRGLQTNFTDMTRDEFNRLNEAFTAYTRKNAEEQTERLEDMRKQLFEKISDAKIGMEGSISNATTMFSSAVKSYERAVELYKEQYLQIARRMDALEEQLRKESVPESKE